MLICLNGAPGAGKTTFADYVCSTFGFKKLDLARPFKDFSNEMLDFNPEKARKFKDQGRGITNVSLRDVYIAVADAVELYDPNVWIKNAVKSFGPGENLILDSIGKRSQWEWIQEFHPDLRLIYITDNEPDKIRNNKFFDGRDILEDESDYAITNIFNRSDAEERSSIETYTNLIGVFIRENFSECIPD